jgi:hypothetical protein
MGYGVQVPSILSTLKSEIDHEYIPKYRLYFTDNIMLLHDKDSLFRREKNSEDFYFRRYNKTSKTLKYEMVNVTVR